MIFELILYTYPLSDGSLKPLPFLITILAIVISLLPAADHKKHCYLHASYHILLEMKNS